MGLVCSRVVATSYRISSNQPQLHPQPVGYVIMNPLSVYAPLRLPGMAAAGAWHGVADAGLAMRLRRAGQLLIAWTLDDPGDLARVLDVGESAGGRGRGCLAHMRGCEWV